MIDRIRTKIEERLAEIQVEEKQLTQALAALPSAVKADAPQAAGGERAGRRGRGRTAARPVGKASERARDAAASSGAERASSGATRAKVLEVLSDGAPRTAGEVAATAGLGRASVSTTLSKLAKAGELLKAERGYQLPSAKGPSSSSGRSPRPTRTRKRG